MRLVSARWSYVLWLALGGCKLLEQNPDAGVSPDAETSAVDIDPGEISLPSGCSKRELPGGTYNQSSLGALRGVTHITQSLTVSGADVTDLSELRCLVAVTNHLVIRSTRLTSLDALSGLRYVGGYMSLSDNEELENVDALAGLETITAGFGLRNSPLVARVAFPAIKRLESFIYVGPMFPGSFYLADLPKLQTVLLPQLESTTAGVTIVGSSELADDALTLDFGALRQVGAAIELSTLPQLRSIAGFGSLERIEGPLKLAELERLESLVGLERLETVDGFISIHGLDALTNLDAFSALKKVDQGLGIGSNPLLSTISLPSLTTLGSFIYVAPPFPGSLYINSLPKLTSVQVPMLESTTSDVILRDCGSLNDAALEVILNEPKLIGGALRIEKLATLDDLSAFANIRTLKGTLHVVDNPCIDNDEAATLSITLMATSETISGNGMGCALP